MGAGFPLAARVVVRDVGHVGGALGRLYTANTLGAIAGAVLSGFVLIPWIGTQAGFFLLVSIHLAVSAAVLTTARPGKARRAAVAVVLVGIAVAAGAGLITRGAMRQALKDSFRVRDPDGFRWTIAAAPAA